MDVFSDMGSIPIISISAPAGRNPRVLFYALRLAEILQRRKEKFTKQ